MGNQLSAWHGLQDFQTKESIRLGVGDGILIEPHEGLIGVSFWTKDRRRVLFVQDSNFAQLVGEDSQDLVMRPDSPDVKIIISLIALVLGLKARYVEGLYPEVCGRAPAFRMTKDEEGQAWEFYE